MTAAAPPAKHPAPLETEIDPEVAKQIRIFIHYTGKAFEENFDVKNPWTEAGKERVRRFFEDNPSRVAELYMLVTGEAWLIFTGKTGKDRERLQRKYYYCQQLLNLNDTFKVHPTHNLLMILGAARELGIDVVNADAEECIDRLEKLGFVEPSSK